MKAPRSAIEAEGLSRALQRANGGPSAHPTEQECPRTRAPSRCSAPESSASGKRCTLARAGHRVRLIEASAEPFANAASLYCGGDAGARARGGDGAGHAAPARPRGRRAVAQLLSGAPIERQHRRCRRARPRRAGAFRAAHARSRLVDGAELGALEPDLAGRFTSALYFPEEAHMPAPAALAFMLAEVQRAGVEIILGDRAAEARRDDHRLPGPGGARCPARFARRARRARY